MQTIKFDRDKMARFYAKQHLKCDDGTLFVMYLPQGAPEQEIRLLEVNNLMGDRNDNAFFPIDFDVERGTENEHSLTILDVTPEQWERIKSSELSLPAGWSLNDAVEYIP